MKSKIMCEFHANFFYFTKKKKTKESFVNEVKIKMCMNI